MGFFGGGGGSCGVFLFFFFNRRLANQLSLIAIEKSKNWLLFNAPGCHSWHIPAQCLIDSVKDWTSLPSLELLTMGSAETTDCTLTDRNEQTRLYTDRLRWTNQTVHWQTEVNKPDCTLTDRVEQTRLYTDRLRWTNQTAHWQTEMNKPNCILTDWDEQTRLYIMNKPDCTLTDWDEQTRQRIDRLRWTNQTAHWQTKTNKQDSRLTVKVNSANEILECQTVLNKL